VTGVAEAVSATWQGQAMGHGYEAVCKTCGAKFEVMEGPGMRGMPLHCDRCGKEKWWEFLQPIDLDSPMTKPCPCGGEFRSDAPPRCSSCRSSDIEHDPDGVSYLYD
jgi:predicted nucleic acid-binding Zn ribbon protein